MHGQRHWLPYPAELPGGAAGGGATGPGANLLALLALLDNNVQNVGPYSSADGVSTPGTTIWFDSAPYTFLPSPVPGNATADVKGSLSVSGTVGNVVTFTLVRDRGLADAEVLATQQTAVNQAGTATITLAALDTSLTVPPLTFPLTEQSTHTYSIVATAAAALTGTEPALVVIEQLPSGVATAVQGSGGGPVALNSLANFAGFASAGISITGASHITGSIGLGPGVTSTAFTGFGQTLSAGAPAFNQYATSALVLADGPTYAPNYTVGYTSPPTDQGVLYAADYAVPTPAQVNITNNDMLAAYTDASGRPPGTTNFNGGILAGQSLAPGVYKWTEDVNIENGNLTLSALGTYIFIVTGNVLMTGAGQAIVGPGAAVPGNIVWAVAGSVSLDANSAAVGEIMCKTSIAMTGATLNGRALAQTGLTLANSTITEA